MPTPALYINEFTSGLYTQRSPLVTPTSSVGLSTVVRTDVFAGGSNIELSNNSTPVRRPGFTRYCGAAFSGAERPLNFHSFRNLSGVIKLMVDTGLAVYKFDTGSLTNLFSKGTTQQTNFCTVGNSVYMCNGTDAKKWDGTTVSKWGIATPVAAPTLSLTAGALSPQSGYQYVFVYRNAATGHISTASPVSGNTFGFAGKNVIVQGASSTDPQVTNVDIYRTLDGGSVFYFVASVANGGTWSYTDSTPDANLNNLISAPINHSNDAPPSGINNVVYHMGRMWVSTGRFVYFAGGPDTTNGSPDESFPPANVFTFPGQVTAMVSTTAGLLVFTNGDSYIIRGTDSGSFYAQSWQRNFGVASQNCIVADGDLLYIYTSRRQLFSISNTLEEIGFPIGDLLLAGFDPTQSYLALHRSGNDSGLFLSDGSTSMFRYAITKDAWSTRATVVGSVSCIKSVSITDSDYRLLAGRFNGGGYILYRDLANWQDDGTNYLASVNIGQLVVAPLGALAHINAVSIERMPVGSAASVAVMLQEINTSFTNLPNPVSDPPTLPAETSIITQRHYLSAAATPLPQQVRHLQVQVSFVAENAKNELLGFALLKP